MHASTHIKHDSHTYVHAFSPVICSQCTLIKLLLPPNDVCMLPNHNVDISSYTHTYQPATMENYMPSSCVATNLLAK